MSTRVDPAKFFVPPLPDKYIFSGGQNTKAAEATVLRLLLELDTAPPPAIVVKGPGGTGKTISLIAVGNHQEVLERFSKAVWFISLGQNAHPTVLLENLQEVVRSVAGEAKADEIGRLSKLQDKSSAIVEAVQVLNDHAVLLLFDDVWNDEQAHVVGQSTVFSLVQACLRRVQQKPSSLRVVVSTRDRGVAALVPKKCRVSCMPFEPCNVAARDMLCRYAEASFQEIRTATSAVQASFESVLNRCGGLQLALAIAGSGVGKLADVTGAVENEVWSLYASRLEQLEQVASFLKRSHPDHGAIFTMLLSSLKHLKARLEKDGIALRDDVKVVFSLLAVLQKQEAVPLSVVACIWGLSKEDTLQVCTELAELHLVSLTTSDGVTRMTVHDLILDFCDVLLSEKPGLKAIAHRMTVEGLERMLLGALAAGMSEAEWAGCAFWWKLCDGGFDEWAREYCSRHLARHTMQAGGEYPQRLLYLVTDYRWIEARMKMSKNGNDLSGIVADVQTLVNGCGEELDGDVKIGVELISDAARLATQYVANKPQELPYQLHGRLAVHAGKNSVVDRFLWTLERYAARPWLKAGKGVLTAAGGPVVLSAAFPKPLLCMAVMPNEEDVVVGGDDGYLAVFSIRYASVLYELRGHDGNVVCVAACAARKKIFSGGEDGTIRAWKLGTGQQVGDTLVRHENEIDSLEVKADGSHLMFGDRKGWLVVCHAASGDVKFKWRAHSSEVSALAVRGEDGMIVSGSYDGTIGRWESWTGQEARTRLAVGGGSVWGVSISRDGKRIAFAADDKVGVLDADTGDVLRECGTEWAAWRAVFGSDDETVHFGRLDGTTAALSPDGDVVCDVKAHSAAVCGIVQSHSSQLLVSVSFSCTLSVQNLERAYVSPADPASQYKLEAFVVLPNRKQVLYTWRKGPRGVRLLNLNTTSPETALSTEELSNSSIIIGSSEARVSTIAASRDGRYAVAGTSQGEVILYDTDTWRRKYASLRRLPGSVWCVAISSNGTFLAAGSSGGSVALFLLEDGSEVQLPSSAGLDGKTAKVAFSEESSSLFAMVRNESQATGILHVWKHVDRAAGIEHIALPFNRVSTWNQPYASMTVIANTSHIATRGRADSRACVYDFAADRYSEVSTEEEDETGLIQLSTREHAAFESAGTLFMAPFDRTIRYCHRAGRAVLGTIEEQTAHNFRPVQWTFDNHAGIFLTGGFCSRLVSAVLMREQEGPQSREEEEPKLLPIRKAVSQGVGSTLTSAIRSQYNVFISHAGPDKTDIALPLYRRLLGKGLSVFVDKDELRPADEGIKRMESAMQTADMGVFITSPDFVVRQWPMSELACFLRRSVEDEAEGKNPPKVLPVFYRLSVHECRRPDLFNRDDIALLAAKEGFFLPARQKKMAVLKTLECLKGLARFTGIENEKGVVNDADCSESRMENQMWREELLERIVDGVMEALDRRRQVASG